MLESSSFDKTNLWLIIPIQLFTSPSPEKESGTANREKNETKDER